VVKKIIKVLWGAFFGWAVGIGLTLIAAATYWLLSGDRPEMAGAPIAIAATVTTVFSAICAAESAMDST